MRSAQWDWRVRYRGMTTCWPSLLLRDSCALKLYRFRWRISTLVEGGGGVKKKTKKNKAPPVRNSPALLRPAARGCRWRERRCYLGSLLNLCVTVADFPLHFSHEYSISSICEKGNSRRSSHISSFEERGSIFVLAQH